MSATTREISTRTGLPECAVIVLFSLSYPIRNALRTIIVTADGYIQARLGEMVAATRKFDFLSNMLGTIQVGLEEALQPVDHILTMIPFGELVETCPELNRVVDAITNNLHITVNSTAFTNFIGIGGLDSLEGVDSYLGARRKIRELTFRIQRMVTISGYANVAKQKLQEQSALLRQYIEVLDSI